MPTVGRKAVVILTKMASFVEVARVHRKNKPICYPSSLRALLSSSILLKKVNRFRCDGQSFMHDRL